MKSSQLNFFCLPEELAKILQASEDRGCVILDLQGNIYPQKIEEFLAGGKFYVCPPSCIEKIVFQNGSENLKFLDEDVSEVFEVSIPVLRSNRLSRGRIRSVFGYTARDVWAWKSDALRQEYAAMHKQLKNELLTKESALGGFISVGVAKNRSKYFLEQF